MSSEAYGGQDGAPPLFSVPASVDPWAGFGTCSPGHHEPNCGHDVSGSMVARTFQPSPDALTSVVESAIRAEERRTEATAILRELERHAEVFGPVMMTGEALAALLYLLTGE